jgi:hypothetical protein
MDGKGNKTMAYPGSKGWYIQKLKELGIRSHPTERKKLELYKTHILRNLYMEISNGNKEK